MKDLRVVLRPLGLSGRYKGFRQLCCALELTAKEPERLNAVRESVCKEVAREFNCSWGSVDRNLRTIIARAWKVNPALLSEMAKDYPLTKKPSVGEFLELLTTYMLRED